MKKWTCKNLQDKLWACREVKDNQGNEVTVGGVRLYCEIDGLLERGTKEQKRQARAVDEEIVFFIEDKYLDLDDDELMEKLHEECPEVF